MFLCPKMREFMPYSRQCMFWIKGTIYFLRTFETLPTKIPLKSCICNEASFPIKLEDRNVRATPFLFSSAPFVWKRGYDK